MGQKNYVDGFAVRVHPDSLAMPVSWKGTLQQYAGRLHRRMYAKNDVRIYDYIDEKNPLLARMWERRKRGYTGMGYRIISRELPRTGSLL
jgi:superfamily II DNA or RNA helicase